MIRKYDSADLDKCVDLYIDFVEAFSKEGDDAWNENELCRAPQGHFGESPVFEGWILEEGGSPVAFMLGVASYGSFGKSYDMLELFTAQGRNVQAHGQPAHRGSRRPPQIEGYDRLGCLSSELWSPDFLRQERIHRESRSADDGQAPERDGFKAAFQKSALRNSR